MQVSAKPPPKIQPQIADSQRQHDGIDAAVRSTGEAESVKKNGRDVLLRVRVLIQRGLRYVTILGPPFQERNVSRLGTGTFPKPANNKNRPVSF
jgi:hypothetical protein